MSRKSGEERALIEVHLTPGASRTEIVGDHDGVLRVRVAAPPAEGRANEALCRLIAGKVGVPRSRVSIARGQAARRKLVAVAAVDRATVLRALSSQ